MNYCSISDAWGNKNNNIENVQPHNNKQNYIELDSNNEQSASLIVEPKSQHFGCRNNEVQNTGLIEHFKPHNNKVSCDDFLEHINSCRYCNERMKLKYKSTLLDNFQNNKDTCIL